MTRLVIHIGDCKSGSTSIQSVLQAGSYSADRPILYPEAGRRGGLNHHRLSNSLFMARARQWQARAWGALAEELRGHEGLAVISSERFEFADPAILRQVLSQHFDPLPDLHLVAYVRPHLDRLLSGYAQNIRQGLLDLDLPAFLDQMAQERRFHFAPRLDRWRAAFPDAQFDIRPMIRAELEGACVVHDFLNLTLAASGGRAEVTSIPRGNTSLSAPALALMRALWRDRDSATGGPDSPRAQAMERFARQLETDDPFGGARLAMPRALADRARDIYAEDARACDVRLFARPVLVPALERGVAAAPETVPDPVLPALAVELSTLWLKTLEQTGTQRPPAPARSATSAQWRGLRG